VSPIALPESPRILVIVLRHLGDVLLTTPLIRSLKQAYPAAAIDALVLSGTEGILTGNPDLSGIIAMPENWGFGAGLALLRRLGRCYDLALSTQAGDRPIAWACLAGRRSIGLVEPQGIGAAVKRIFLSRSCEADKRRHHLLEILQLAEAIGIRAVPEVICPAGPLRTEILPKPPYAVVHAPTTYRYKTWHRDGWRKLAVALRERGLQTIVTGAAGDRAYLDEVWRDCDVVRLDGKLTWPELATLITVARVYVGLDTAVTHLAAATGASTVALYGPTDPRIWGPWPAGGLDQPWAAAGTIQQRHNVWLVQNPKPCLPCQLEGCERHRNSHSDCLDELPSSPVMSAVDRALAVRQAA
jgi:heptosyltransferase-3